MASKASSPTFGKRRQQHIIILASGDKIRHMTVRPWMAAVTFCVIGMMAVGYLGATSYLVLRDNLIGATMARQARMQHDYEDRIASLRAQVDRVTSRQLLDQQVVEKKVEKLLAQQMALTSRHGRLDSLLDRAGQSGVTPTDVPVPSFRPESDDRAELSNGGLKAIDNMMATNAQPAADTKMLGYAPLRENVADKADRIFSNVTISLKNIEQEQLDRIQNLTEGATETASAIESILKGNGIRLETASIADGDADTTVAMDTADDEGSAVGGPYMAPETGEVFDNSLDDLDSALSRLEAMRNTARSMPFANPAPGKVITSRFGNRVDPFLGKLAMHSGVDFREKKGGNIRSTGAGKVVVAGPYGGYGNLVEIDHGMGIHTRFGHLSKVLVSVGQHVEPGDLIGLAGSTGRSTGTHLHYEVRRNGHAVDPMRFLNAGMKLESLVN